jgi:hypothetical protein
MFARRAFWCIVATARSAGLDVRPYHAYVPSFGEWGFVLAGRGGYTLPESLPAGLRFLTRASLSPLFQFPADLRRHLEQHEAIEAAFLQAPRRRQAGDAAADDDDGHSLGRRRGSDGRPFAKPVAGRQIVVDERAGQRTIALDRQADEGGGGGDAEFPAARGQRLISRHSDSSVRTST